MMRFRWPLAAGITLFFACAVGYAGTMFDDFTSDKLEEVWEISKTSQAKYEIKDGTLILTTPLMEQLIFTGRLRGQRITFV